MSFPLRSPVAVLLLRGSQLLWLSEAFANATELSRKKKGRGGGMHGVNNKVVVSAYTY